MDGTLVVAIVAVILAAGSLLVAAVSFAQSMTGKQTDIRIQAEQRKQEALGILRQAQLSIELTLRLYRNQSPKVEELVDRSQELDDDSEKNVWQIAQETSRVLIEVSEETIRNFKETIKVIEEMKPPQGKFDSSYLVRLETNIGYAESVRLLAEHGRALLDEAIISIERRVTANEDEDHGS